MMTYILILFIIFFIIFILLVLKYGAILMTIGMFLKKVLTGLALIKKAFKSLTKLYVKIRK